MKVHTMGLTFYFTQEYLPSKRFKIPRKREMVTNRDVEVIELEKGEFPIAMIVEDYASLYRGAKDTEDFFTEEGGEYTRTSDEIRYYKGRFFKARRYSYGTAVSDLYQPDSDAFDGLRKLARIHVLTCYEGTAYSDARKTPFVEGKSIVISDDIDERIAFLRSIPERYVLYDGKI